MSAQMISLILSAIVAVFVVVGVLFGIGRGVKKSGVRLLWLVVWGVILFFLTGVITKAIVNMNIDWAHLSYKGSVAHTPVDYLTLVVSDLAGANANADSIAKLAVALANMLMGSIIFALLFFAAKYIFYPAYALVARLVCGKRVKVKKGEPKPQVNKHRVWGGVVGAVSGLLMSMLVTMPIVGYLNVAQKVDNATKVSSSSGKGILTTRVGEPYTMAVDGYNKSAMKYIYRYTGMEFLSNAIFGGLSKGTIDGDTIYLNKEVDQLTKAYDLGYGVYNKYGDIKNFTQAQMDDYLNQADNALKHLYDSKIVTHAGDVAIPIAIELVDTDSLTSSSKPYVKAFVNECVNTLKTYNVNGVKNTTNGVVKILKTINSRDLLLPIIKGEQMDVESVARKLDKQFADDLMTQLFEVKLVSELAPSVANVCLSYLDDMYDFGYIKPNEITAQVARENITNLVVKAVDAAVGIDSNYMMYYNPENVSKIGALLDTVKQSALITDQTYTGLLNMLSDKLNAQVDKLPMSTAVISDIKVAINQLSSVSNWTQEFTAIQNAVVELNDALADKDGKFSSDIQTFKFNRIGKAVDYLQNGTTLFGTPIGEVDYTHKLVSDVLDWAQTKYMGDYATSMNNTVSVMKTNVLNADYQWESALGNCEKLFKTLAKVFDSKDSMFEQIKDTTNPLVSDLGSALNTATNSALLGNAGVQTFVCDVLDIVEDSVVSTTNPTDMDATISNCVTKIKTNINTVSDVNWQTEFVNLQKLFKNEFGDINLDNYTPLTNSIDSVIESNSKLITYDVVNTMLLQVINDNLASYNEPKYQNVINSIKERVVTIDANAGTTYTDELGYIKQLTSTITNHNLAGITIDSDFTAVAQEFDNVKGSYLLYDAGYLIVDTILSEYVTDKNSDVNFEYGDVLTTITNNFQATKSQIKTTDNFYQDLFGNLQQINTEMANINSLTFNKDSVSATATTLQAKLDTLQNNNLVNINGVKQIAIIAVDKVKGIINDYKTELTASGVTGDRLTALDDALAYANNYTAHLNGDTNSQPYNSETDTYTTVAEANGIAINKPFTRMAQLIEQAKTTA